MPEYEILNPDARCASRWHPLRDRLARGEPPDAIFPNFRDEFFQALRCAFNQCKNRGVNFSQMFEAALNDPVKLRGLVNRTGNHDYARLLLRTCTAGDLPQDLEAVIRSFLDAVWDNIRDLVQIDRHEAGVPDSFVNQVDQMLERLARDLLKDPSRMPRRPSRRKSSPDIDDMLGESLPLA